jgi:hypothetical protein
MTAPANHSACCRRSTSAIWPICARACLLDGRAILETADEIQRLDPAVATDTLGSRDDVRQVHVRGLSDANGICEPGRHHPEDGPHAARRRHRPADDRRIGAEPSPPETIADHDDAIAALDLMFGSERRANGGHDAQQGKEIRRRPQRQERLRIARAASRHGEVGARRCREVLKDVLPRAPVKKVRRRVANRPVGGFREASHCHQTIAVLERQTAEHHGVDHGENRRGGAEAEREHHQRDQGHAGCAAKRPDRMGNVLRQR